MDTGFGQLGSQVLDSIRAYFGKEDSSRLVPPSRQVFVHLMYDKCVSLPQENEESSTGDDDAPETTPADGCLRKPPHNRELKLPHCPNKDEKVCLIVKAPQRKWKDKVNEEGLDNTIVRVIDIEKLKRKFERSEDRMLLQKSYDIFYCDSSIIERVNPFLGMAFRKSWKQPLRIRLDENGSIKPAFEKLYNGYTCYKIMPGVFTSVRIGNLALPNEQLMENAVEVITQLQQILQSEINVNIKAVKLACGQISVQLVEPPQEIQYC